MLSTHDGRRGGQQAPLRGERGDLPGVVAGLPEVGAGETVGEGGARGEARGGGRDGLAGGGGETGELAGAREALELAQEEGGEGERASEEHDVVEAGRDGEEGVGENGEV